MRFPCGPGVFAVFSFFTMIFSVFIVAMPWWAIEFRASADGFSGKAVLLYGWQQAFCSVHGDVRDSYCQDTFGATSWLWHDRCLLNQGNSRGHDCTALGVHYNIVGAIIGAAMLCSVLLFVVVARRGQGLPDSATSIFVANVCAVLSVVLTAGGMVLFAVRHAPAVSDGWDCTGDIDICTKFAGSYRVSDEASIHWLPAGWIAALITVFPLAFTAWGAIGCGGARAGAAAYGNTADGVAMADMGQQQQPVAVIGSPSGGAGGRAAGYIVQPTMVAYNPQEGAVAGAAFVPQPPPPPFRPSQAPPPPPRRPSMPGPPPPAYSAYTPQQYS